MPEGTWKTVRALMTGASGELLGTGCIGAQHKGKQSEESRTSRRSEISGLRENISWPVEDKGHSAKGSSGQVVG